MNRTLPPWALEVARSGTRVSSRLLWRLCFRGLENIPPPETGGLVVAANHQTYFDPFWISIPIKRPMRYLAWDEAFNWPVLGRFLALFGAWPLQLQFEEGAAAKGASVPTVRPAIRRSLQWLRGGGALLIFPEGARCKSDGEMARFKPGAARMALEAGVPILPVTLRGGHRVWPRGWRAPRPGPRVEITYHPLYRVEQLPDEDSRKCALRASSDLNRIIRSAL